MPLPQKHSITSDIAVLLSQMADIKADVKDIKQKMEEEYATKEWVVSYIGQTKNIVSGLIGLILTAVILSLVALVIKQQ